MKKITFTTMAGTEIQVDRNLLAKEYVEQTARQYFKQEVTCTPCVFGTGVVAVGWRIESKETAKIIGFLALSTGVFSDYPDDFEYGVTVVVPLSKQWATISKFRVCYIDDVIEIDKV